MGFSCLSKDILNAMSLQEALKSHRNKEREVFQMHRNLATFPHPLGTHVPGRHRCRPVETGKQEGERRQIDPKPPLHWYQARLHLRFQGTDLTSDVLLLLEVSGTAGSRGTFFLGTQWFEISLARRWLLLAFVLQQLSQQAPWEVGEMSCNYVLYDAPQRNIWPYPFAQGCT